MRTIGLICLLVLLAGQCCGETLSGIISQLRARVNEQDTTTSIFTNATAIEWANMAQHKIVKIGGYIDKSVDVYWTEADSLGVSLPSDFRTDIAAMVWNDTQWDYLLKNPYLNEGSGKQYFCAMKRADTAVAYFKGFFVDSTRVRIFYKGIAAEMDALGDTCEVQADLIGAIVEEMFSYYMDYKAQYQVAMAIRQQNRTDMGIIQQVEK